MEAFLALDGSFTLSDDSHGTSQVGLNFARTLEKARAAGIATIYHLTGKDGDSRPGSLSCAGFEQVEWRGVALEQILTALPETLTTQNVKSTLDDSLRA